jgi:hypothetical protein
MPVKGNCVTVTKGSGPRCVVLYPPQEVNIPNWPGISQVISQNYLLDNSRLPWYTGGMTATDEPYQLTANIPPTGRPAAESLPFRFLQSFVSAESSSANPPPNHVDIVSGKRSHQYNIGFSLHGTGHQFGRQWPRFWGRRVHSRPPTCFSVPLTLPFSHAVPPHPELSIGAVRRGRSRQSGGPHPGSRGMSLARQSHLCGIDDRARIW